MAPFDKLGFEVNLFSGYFIQIDITVNDPLFHKQFAAFISLIQINSSDERLKSISIHVAVVRRGAGRILDELIQADFNGQLVQRLSLYDLGTCIGQETFPFPFETFVDNISHDGVEDGVT